MNCHPKKSGLGHRAWNVLRLALLWARKGGVFKRRLLVDLRLFPSKFLKVVGHSTTERGAIRYGERELSFEKTPIIHVKMYRPTSSMRFRIPHMPCIKPQVDFDFDFDDNDAISYCNEGARKSFLTSGGGEEEEDDDDNCYQICEGTSQSLDRGDEEIDLKAEQFIAKFYEQMKLQRQRSYLQYNEMLNRGTS